jgi:hypothetical protein
MEWLQHHVGVGVDLFFVYDNESSPPISEIINKSLFKDRIMVFEAPGRVVQMQSYGRCIEGIKSGSLPLCDWLAVIDEDEFIICENGDIKKTMEEYAEYSGLVINWRVYGSSGLKCRTPDPQMGKFVHPTSPDNFVNWHVKSIVNPLKVKRPRRNPHVFRYLEGESVGVDHIPLVGLWRVPVYKKIWINHYYTRSQEEWATKVRRTNPDSFRAYIDLATREEVPGFYRNPNGLVEIDADCEEHAKRNNNE